MGWLERKSKERPWPGRGWEGGERIKKRNEAPLDYRDSIVHTISGSSVTDVYICSVCVCVCVCVLVPIGFSERHKRQQNRAELVSSRRAAKELRNCVCVCVSRCARKLRLCVWVCRFRYMYREKLEGAFGGSIASVRREGHCERGARSQICAMQ